MKCALTVITILILSLGCNAQGSFLDYLENSREADSIRIGTRMDYKDIFYPGGKYKEIDPGDVRTFICTKDIPCDLDNYRFDYGVKIPLNDGFYSVLIHKQKFEGETVYDFDLSETLLYNYDKNGKILSSKSIAKDNDAWLSQISISKKHLVVVQAKILEFGKSSLPCEIEVKEYAISAEGMISEVKIHPNKKGLVVWDKITQEFIIQ